MYILGINAYDHDVSACLLKNGRLVAAISKERLTRVKHDSGFYSEVVDYVLAEAGISLSRVDLVVRNTYQLDFDEMERLLASYDETYFLSDRERERAANHPLFDADSESVVTCSHHLAHAYSAFAVSPFERGAVMVVDGIGSYRGDVTEEVPGGEEVHPAAREAESYYRFDGTEIHPVRKVFMEPGKTLLRDPFYMMPGIGAVYSRVSTYVFGHWDKCGEVMGLAPYGRAGFPPLFEVLEGELRVHDWPGECRHPWRGGTASEWEASPHRREWEDLAWRVQQDTERALIERARWLHEETGATDLVISGGVALNCVANGRILEESPFERVFIQPAAGDDGIALGCALHGHLAIRGGKREFVMDSPACGRAYSPEEIDAAARSRVLRFVTSSKQGGAVIGDAADHLAAGRVLGWFTGPSEYGPRALGHRSILADPRDARMKDRLNASMKFRQAFRLFAPAVPAERAEEFFEGSTESPFMILAKRVKPGKADAIPAVTHVDGTARVQTVRREANPRFHALLTAFGERTGVPVLLNTSFNVRGEPIVETPDDAIDCFLATGIDVLVLEDRLIEKRAIWRALRPLVGVSIGFRKAARSKTLLERAAERILDR
jgi:carbamoyltransferase